MIPLIDIRSQIYAITGPYIGILPSDLTPRIYGDICSIIMGVDGVASVGLHFGPDNAGNVDACVELSTGEVITVCIAEADCGVDDERPLDDRIGHLVDSRIFDHEVAVQARFTKLEKALSGKIVALTADVARMIAAAKPVATHRIDGYPLATFSPPTFCDAIGKHTI